MGYFLIKQSTHLWFTIFFCSGCSNPPCLQCSVYLACGDAGCSFSSECVKVTCSNWAAAELTEPWSCHCFCSPVYSKFSEAGLRKKNLSLENHSLLCYHDSSLCRDCTVVIIEKCSVHWWVPAAAASLHLFNQSLLILNTLWVQIKPNLTLSFFWPWTIHMVRWTVF